MKKYNFLKRKGLLFFCLIMLLGCILYIYMFQKKYSDSAVKNATPIALNEKDKNLKLCNEHKEDIKKEEDTLAKVTSTKVQEENIKNENTEPKPKDTSKTMIIKEVLLSGKKVLDLSYEEVIKSFGAPKDIIQFKTKFPACTEDIYINVLKYDGLDIEMYPLKEGENLLESSSKSFRFDITGEEYPYYDVKVGMTLEEVFNIEDKREAFLVKDILKMDTENFKIPLQYKKLLTDLKPKDYYKDYEEAVYKSVRLENGTPCCVVMLFKNGKVARIVYGNPNAS